MSSAARSISSWLAWNGTVRHLHDELHVTTMLVTHDQEEAFETRASSDCRDLLDLPSLPGDAVRMGSTRWWWSVVALQGLSAAAAAQTLGPSLEVAAAPVESSSAGTQSVHALAASGTSYVLAYGDRTTGSESRLARASAAGPGLVVTELELRLPRVLDLACRPDGTCAAIGLIYPDSGGIPSLTVRRFDALRDVPLDADPLTLDTASDGETPVGRIAATATEFMVVHGSATRPFAARTLTLAGLSAPTSLGASWTTSADLACGMGICTFVGYSSEPFVQRLTETGTLLDAVPIALSPAAGGSSANIAFDGTSFRVYQRRFDVGRGYRVSATGMVTGTVVLPAPLGDEVSFDCGTTGDCLIGVYGSFGVWEPDDSTTPIPPWSGREGVRVACSGAECAWATAEAGTVTVRVDSAGSSRGRAAFGVGAAADIHTGPLGVANGIALFHRQTELGWDLIARRLDGTGAPTGPESLIQEMLGAPERTPIVRSDAGWGLLHTGASGPDFVRLDSSGTVTERAPIGSCQGDTRALAWNGTHYLVACRDFRGAAVVRRLDSIGQRVDPTATMLVPAEVNDVDVATDGAGWQVVALRGTFLRAYGIGADGTIADTAGTLIRDHSLRSPRIVAFAGGHVVAWLDVSEDATTGEEVVEIRATVLSPEGAVSPVGGTTVARTSYVDDFALASIGADVVVGWRAFDSTGTRRSISLALIEGGRTARAPIEVDVDRSDLPVSPIGLAIGGDPLCVLHATSNVEPRLSPTRARLRTIEFPCDSCTDAGVRDSDAGSPSDAASPWDALFPSADGGDHDAGRAMAADAGPAAATTGSCTAAPAARTFSFGPTAPMASLMVIAICARRRRRPARRV